MPSKLASTSVRPIGGGSSSSSGQDGSRSAANGRQAPPLPAQSPMRSSFSSLLSPRIPTHSSTEQLDDLLTAQFPDPTAYHAFGAALEEDQGKQEPPALRHSNGSGSGAGAATATAAASAWTKLGLPSLRSPSAANEGGGDDDDKIDPAAEEPTQTVPVHASSRVKVGKIAAVSDFAPVRERTASRRSGSATAASDTGRREGFIYAILRWPLLFAIFITIGLEFFAYVFTRQIVNLVEWLLAHRGRKGVLRRQLRKAETFQQWRDTALELDDFMQHEKWKTEDASGLYDWILIKKVLHSLRTFREQGEAQELMAVLDLCCRNNFAGTENFRLYSETYYGTKYLIEAYLAEVELGLNFVTQTDKIPLEQKRAFFRGVSKNLGRSGLCLSGGGAFGYYHIGLVRALLDADLLPKIVSGTSAGGLIAALTCTRCDEELAKVLVPELADRITACEEPIRIWAARAWKTGARFDPLLWAEKAAYFTRGSLTFKEAFELTGKTLNISVIPSDKHSPTKLLNHLTAPRCVIWSALLASAAVPGLLPPVCLMQKTRKGDIVPWNWGHRFKDGSLRVDIPLQDLHSMFHVNYPIVSQVNPHVHLFFFAPKGMPGRPVAHRKGKGWRGGFILSASEHVLKLHLSLNFKIIRDLDLLPAILGTDWSGVFLQRFDGAVTIWPKTRFWDWVRILSDPDRTELARMIRVGRAATFPKLHMIENRIRIERAVEAGRRTCRQALRKQLKAAGEVNTPGGGPVDTPNQDSGTDASVGPSNRASRFHAMHSDTDGGGGEGEGGGVSQQQQPAMDYFRAKDPSSSSGLRNRPRPRGTNNAIAAARRRFGNAMGMGVMTAAGGNNTRGSIDALGTPGTDGTMSPASEVGTPGELPRPSRARSMGLDDDDGRGVMEDDEDEGETTIDAGNLRSNSNNFLEDFAMRARGHRLAVQASRDEDGQTSPLTPPPPPSSSSNPQRALTAADLTPEANRFGSRRGSRQSQRDHHYHHHQRYASARQDDHHSANSGPNHHQYDARSQGWSANRGSIGPESPWDMDDDDVDVSSSDSESDEQDAAGA